MKHEFRMIRIGIGLIFFMMVTDTNAGFVNSLSKEITKFIRPRSESVNVFPLVSDPKSEESIKTDEEFDIALATERLGFVYCNVKQEPFMGKFVKEFLKISQGHSALLNTLVPRKVTPAHLQRLMGACSNYLQDDVLVDNGLRLSAVDKNITLVQAVERVVHIDYFAAKPYKFAALQCPVRIYDQYNTKVKTIFFSALGSTEDETEEDSEESWRTERKKRTGKVGRPYYVFANYTKRDKTKFKILMRTVQLNPNTGPEDRSPLQPPEKITSRIYDHPERCPIRLHVKPERFNDGFRLYGKDAEAAFLTETLRFFNKSYNPYKINRFLDTVLEMKKGYEILSYYEWIAKFITNQNANLSAFGEKIPFNCHKYVKGASSLQKFRPVLKTSGDVEQVTIKIYLKISRKSVNRRFYQCSAIFANEEYFAGEGEATINVIPVSYRSHEKCKEHAFYDVTVMQDIELVHREQFFSSVDVSEEKVAAVQPATVDKPNQPIGVDEPVENVEPDGGVQSTDGLVPDKGPDPIEGVGSNKAVKPGSDVEPVGGNEFVEGAEPSRGVEPVESDNLSSREDLSGSMEALEPHLHETGNEGDVSEISDSIGTSGDLRRE